MQMISGMVPRARYLARGAIDVSQKAWLHLHWFDYDRSHERNAARTCRYFKISRQTFYRWRGQFDPHDPRSLEDLSHRPQRRRQRTWTAPLVERVLGLRRQYPRWGKDMLGVLLAREGCDSNSARHTPLYPFYHIPC